MRKRTRSRELALQFLYQLDLRGDEVLPELAPFLSGETEDKEITSYAQTLVDGCREHRQETDSLIQETAHNWDLSRIAVVDRNIIRLACYEMLFRDDIPPRVAINEALEISKKFSSAKSSRFVNGILDRILSRWNRTDPEDSPS